MASVIIQKGGAAGGRMECDGVKHLFIYAQYKEYGLPEYIRMGKCPNPAVCKQKAAFLIQQEKEAAERAAKMATMPPTAPPTQTTSPASAKKG